MKKVIIKLIRFYQKNISFYYRGRCKYYPSCSQYFIESVEVFGVLKGSLKGILRLLKCNPFSKGGFNPVKKSKTKR